MLKNKRPLLIVGAIAFVISATVALADTYWSGEGSGFCICPAVMCAPWAEWGGTWHDNNLFEGTWHSGDVYGTFSGTVTYTGQEGCPYRAIGTWTVDDGPEKLGDFTMCFVGNNCYGSWDADYVPGCNCNGTMSGTKQ